MDAALKNPTIAEARKLVESKAQQGFDLGTGLMKRAASPFEIERVRNAIKGENLKAFDMALALHTAQVTRKVPAGSPSSKQVAGYLVLQGMRGQPKTNTLAVATVLAKDSGAKSGAAKALKDVTAAQKNLTRQQWTEHYVMNKPAPVI
jgi:hypothetical protein